MFSKRWVAHQNSIQIYPPLLKLVMGFVVENGPIKNKNHDSVRFASIPTKIVFNDSSEGAAAVE